jgi:bifunctional NMN adenylyltransferase/nudix hydrolase
MNNAAAMLSPSSEINLHTLDAVAFVGRFQPFHSGHMAVIQQAFNHAHLVVVAIGSARSPRTYRNPFTYEERKRMIVDSVAERNPQWVDRLRVVPIEDMTYSDESWIAHVHQRVSSATGDDAEIALIGHQKDHSSYYLNMFPDWDAISVKNHRSLSGTSIRQAYFSNIGQMWLSNCDGHKPGDLAADKLVPPAVKVFLDEFIDTPDYKYLVNEYDYIHKYRAQFSSLPFPPFFVTVDACIVQSGHILLVKRKSQPGKGLWALPGGFMREDETIIQATMRELREETKIRVPEPVLRGSIITTRTFDDPFRSARGRTITHCSLIQLKRDGKLPVVRGSDDAEKAKWVKLHQVQPEEMFDDHFSIIQALVGQI